MLERPGGLRWATGGILDLNQLLVGCMVAYVCVFVFEVGRPGGPGSDTEQINI